jgi:hypothetical protein
VVSFPQFSLLKPCISLSCPHKRYMPRPSHSSRFYHPKNTGWGVEIIKLLMMYFSPLPCYLVPLKLQYSPQLPVLKHSQPMFPIFLYVKYFYICWRIPKEDQGIPPWLHVTSDKRLGEFSQVINTNFRVLLFGMQLVFRNTVTISGY